MPVPKNSGGKITEDMEFPSFSFSSGGWKIGRSKICWVGAESFCPSSMQGRLNCWGFFFPLSVTTEYGIAFF